MQPARQVFFICATALALCGCVGYRLGPTTSLGTGSKTILVQPFANQTHEPHLTDALVAALRKQIQRNGTYRLTTKGDADVAVTGRIVDYKRTELSYKPTDAVSVLDYRLALTVHVVAREIATGRVILQKEVQSSTLVRLGADLANAERQALPILADTMAKNITDLLADGDWESNPQPGSGVEH